MIFLGEKISDHPDLYLAFAYQRIYLVPVTIMIWEEASLNLSQNREGEFFGLFSLIVPV